MADKRVTSGVRRHTIQFPSYKREDRGNHHAVPKLQEGRQQDNMMQDKTGDKGRLPAHHQVPKLQEIKQEKTMTKLKGYNPVPKI